ncbi:MAG TPA: glycosyltransferase family 39 protein [Solirubrobacteraceae bacterium]|nr:glycosyltransferase family 39 protein [Solirubrobacteraceae bacterium]
MSATTTVPPVRLGAGDRLRALVRGRPDDPAWVRPGIACALLLAAVLCLWELTSSGYSNTYYAAAAKAGSESWKAWFFGSLDPGSFITVDKPPLSLWLMGLSARVLGFSSFSILLPQALCTVGAVGLLYATVRRVFSPGAAVLAAAALAITPVTIAIGRVNNPDALLVLLLVASAYFTVRAVQSGRTRHLALAGAMVGLAFMTKMLQGWMVLPALAAAYAIAGPPRPGRRVAQLAVAGVVTVAVSAAWPLAVSLWPGSAPYIGGSQDGSAWDLILGYNGLGRIFGEGAGGAGGGMGFGGAAGLWRMFNAQVGGQIAWLLPLAGAGLLAGLWLTRRAPRTSAARAGWVLFGVWALVHVVVFSFQRGTFHPYYASALAPAVAALAAGGAVAMWGWARDSWAGTAALAASVAVTAYVALLLLGRTPDFAPWLRYAIYAAAVVAVIGLVMRRQGPAGRRAIAAVAVAVAFATAAGPAAYSLATAGRALNGNNVIAGPASSAQWGPGGGGGAGAGSVSAETIAYLQAHQGSARYLVAASGSQTTAGIIIATGEPVVTIGGFTGSDPTPRSPSSRRWSRPASCATCSSGAAGWAGPVGSSSSELATWAEAHGTAVTDAGVTNGTLYEISA